MNPIHYNTIIAQEGGFYITLLCALDILDREVYIGQKRKLITYIRSLHRPPRVPGGFKGQGQLIALPEEGHDHEWKSDSICLDLNEDPPAVEVVCLLYISSDASADGSRL